MSRTAKVVVITALAVFMGYLDAVIVNIAFPAIARSFPGDSRAELAWILNAYNIVFAALVVPAGRTADLVGRRRLFMIGVGLFSAASLACAAAPSAGALIVARVGQAAGAAMMIPTSLALLLPEFPVNEKAKAAGMWGIGGGLAAAAGPSLGGLIVDKVDWRWIFIANLPVGAAIMAAGRRVLVERRASGRALMPDFVGSGLLAVALGLIAMALTNGPRWGWQDLRTLGSLAAALVALSACVARTRHHPVPVIEVSVLRVRSVLLANVSTLLFACAFYAMLLTNVLFLTSVWRYSILTAGVALTPTPLVMALTARSCGRIADRVGHRAVAAVGCVTYAGAATWFATRVGAQPRYLADWLPAAIIGGLGIALALPVLASASVHRIPSDRLAVGTGVNAAARQIGAVLGVSALIAVVGSPAPTEALRAFDAGWIAIALLALAGCAAAIAMGRGVSTVESRT